MGVSESHRVRSHGGSFKMSHGGRGYLNIVMAITIISWIAPSVKAATYAADVAALTAFQLAVASSTIAASWNGTDPCGDGWLGVTCVTDNVTGITRVSSLVLNNENLVSSQLPSDLGQLTNLTTLSLSFNQGLTGTIPSALGNLTQLITLDLQGCSFMGSIPDEIGNMTELYSLFINSNNLTGGIPSTVGKLTNLVWFDISNNSISGPLPFSPGLATLSKLEHIHFQNNQLNGTIPAVIGNLSGLEHLILHSNNFGGAIPSNVTNLHNLTVMSLGSNSFTFIPSSVYRMASLRQLSAPYNIISGNLPNITNNSRLVGIDLGNNNLSGVIPTGFGSGLSKLVTLDLSNCNLTGVVPESLGKLESIQNLNLSRNSFNGSMPYNLNTYSSLFVVDLEYNNLTDGIAPGLIYSDQVINWFYGNPICDLNITTYLPCQPRYVSFEVEPLSLPCNATSCEAGQYPTAVDNACTCVFPLIANIYFSTPPFQYISSTLISNFEAYFASSLSLDTDKVLVVNNNGTSLNNRPYFEVAFFPNSTANGSILSDHTMDWIITAFSTHLIRTSAEFGPITLLSFSKPNSIDSTTGAVSQEGWDSHSDSDFETWKIVVVLVASLIGLFLLFIASALYIYLVLIPHKLTKQKLRFENQMQKYHCIKFTLTELAISTENFNDSVKLGKGGFAVVYHGKGPDKEDWAIKKTIKANIKGLEMFWSEVEAISKLNHVNILKLLGYCDDDGEQILVYEFCAKGTVTDHLWKNKGNPPMPYLVRLKIASGVASALEYLHSFSTPGLIHRDVKTDNILLTESMQAKLADFTLLRKLNEASDNSIAGTPGYMDPEYFRTGEVTTYSDVYSFGVVLFELVTGKPPTFVEDKESGDVTSLASWAAPYVAVGQFERIIDPFLVEEGTPLEDLKAISMLAAVCVERLSTDRPDMSEVVNRLGRLQYRNSLESMKLTAESRLSSFSVGSASNFSSDDMSGTSSVPQVSFMSNFFDYAPRD